MIQRRPLHLAFVFTNLVASGCAEERDVEAHEIPGVGLVEYGIGTHAIATITFPAGGAVQFVESGAEEDGYGCAGFFPADSPGDPALAISGRDGCLATFLQLTSPDTPVPAALLRGSDDLHEAMERTVVDALDEPIKAVDFPLVAEVHPVASGSSNHYNHSCTGADGSVAHWENDHCDEDLGAEHCDPGFLTSSLSILSGNTYRSSYQTGLFCGNEANAVTNHLYHSNGNWVITWSIFRGASAGGPYIFWSLWQGAAQWRRGIDAWGDSQYRHYTVMCEGLVCSSGG